MNIMLTLINKKLTIMIIIIIMMIMIILILTAVKIFATQTTDMNTTTGNVKQTLVIIYRKNTIEVYLIRHNIIVTISNTHNAEVVSLSILNRTVITIITHTVHLFARYAIAISCRMHLKK